MKRLVLVLALALVLVGSASAEPLATYQHTFEFGGSSGGVGGVFEPEYFIVNSRVVEDQSFSGNFYYYPAVSFTGVWLNGVHLTDYTIDNKFYYESLEPFYHLVLQPYAGLPKPDGYVASEDASDGFPIFYGYLSSYIEQLSLSCPESYVFASGPQAGAGYAVTIYVVPYVKYEKPEVSFSVDMVSEVQKPWFDLFGMRGLSASFTPSNPDEDYFILFAGADSWVGQNPDKWIWTRLHGTTDKYKIIFSGNEYIWFVKYKDEIQQFSFNYTGDEGVVPPVIVPDPEPEPPEPKPPVDTPGDVDPDIPPMPDFESPDLEVDFTSAFDDYENMTIYQDFRKMVNGFTTSIMPDISTTELYGYLQQVIAYQQLGMEQLREKYAVPIYNILASVSSFVPSVCWFVVDIAVIFGMFRFLVHILTGPISSAIRERF